MQISVLEEQKQEDAEKLHETYKPSDVDPSSQINQNVSSDMKPDMNDILMGESMVVMISDIIIVSRSWLIFLIVSGVITSEGGLEDLVCAYDYLNPVAKGSEHEHRSCSFYLFLMLLKKHVWNRGVKTKVSFNLPEQVEGGVIHDHFAAPLI